MMEFAALIFKNVLCMSIAGGLSFLLLTAAMPLTKKLFAPSWHRRSLSLSLLFFLVPTGGLSASAVYSVLSWILPFNRHSAIGGVWDNLPSPIISGLASGRETVRAENPVVSVVLPVLTGVWAVVALVLLIRKGLQLAQFRRAIIKTGKPVEDAFLLNMFSSVKKDLGISRKTELLYNPCVATPMLAGLFHPKLILPEISLNRREAAFILRHELTHLKNRDLLTKALSAFVLVIHWFNPFAYILEKRLDGFLELSCDADVVRGMDFEQRKAYGSAILSVLERVSGAERGLYAGLCENKRDMKRRLITMLHDKKPKKISIVLSTLVLAVVCVTGLSISAYAYRAVPEADLDVSVTRDQPEDEQAVRTYGSEADNPLDYQEIERPSTRDEITVVPDEAGTPQYTPATAETPVNPGFIWPTDGGYVSAGVGSYPGHTGMDIAKQNGTGTPIYAAADGVVVRALETEEGYGKYVIIDHGNGYSTLYAMNSKLLVKLDDTVKQGQTIAEMGQSGFSTGVHLHFEIRKNDEIKDPALYVNENNLPMNPPED